MSRFLSILLGSLMLTALMAGCFGGDEADSGDETDATDTPTPTNNTTAPPPNQVPQPLFSMEVISNGTVLEPPYLVTAEQPLDISFDASASTDEDGEVAGYAWTITDPIGKEYTGKGATFDVSVDAAKGSSHVGVWNVQLRVIDDDQGIGQIAERFVLHYFSEETLPGFVGPGTAERQDEPMDRGIGSPLQPGLPPMGTYGVRSISTAANVTEMQITFTFDEGGPMALYLFAPDEEPEDPEATPLATVESSGSPLELMLTAEDLPATGVYKLRWDLDGSDVGEHTVTAVVMYDAPTALPAGLADMLSNDTA